MKRCHSLFLIVAFTAGLLYGEQKATLPVTIRIGPSSQTVRVGQDVYVNVQMTNVSQRPVDCSSYYVNGTDRRFRVEVLDANGNSTTKSAEHPELMPGSLQLCTLDPGESTAREDDLISSFHDFRRPGNYKVRFSRVIDRDEKNGLALSNTVTITVIP